MGAQRNKTKKGQNTRILPWTFAGVCVFLALQFLQALVRFAGRTGGMDNKFSALAREKYIGYVISENAWVAVGYVLLAVVATLLLWPVMQIGKNRGWWVRRRSVVAFSALFAWLVHSWFVMRLLVSRPYFGSGSFDRWYNDSVSALLSLPDSLRSGVLTGLFQVLPWGVMILVFVWYLMVVGQRYGRRGVGALAGPLALAVMAWWGSGFSFSRSEQAAAPDKKPWNVIIVGSDSLRGDRLGVSGYRPERRDGAAAAGVSPAIDLLAKDAYVFDRCLTPIASTMESMTTVMGSQYPHTHGIRQMYPEREAVENANKQTIPLAKVLREKGYDTAAIGDWCAAVYQVLPLGFEDISVSNFDNFKVYLSQAVFLAHTVMPLYFDNGVGQQMYPQLESFAQFVTPEVVTQRVEERIARQAKNGKPFFWHVFYSSNHLPYFASTPYDTMFADPEYKGRNRSAVDFDINEFISGTDVEDKWKALPDAEVKQIRALYDGCTRKFDSCVARILASLEQNGLDDHTIVVITADHGDDLYEPGVTLGHGLSFNGGDQTNHVPLIVHVPGQKGGRFPQTVRTIDIAPTIAELLQVSPPSSWEGRSLAGWIGEKEQPTSRAFYGETGFPFIQFRVDGVERPSLPPMDRLTYIDETFDYQFVVRPEYREPLVTAKQRCLRTDKWRLVCTPTAQGGRHFGLFFLPEDSNGRHDVAKENPEVAGAMRAALEKWIDHKEETPISQIFGGAEPDARK